VQPPIDTPLASAMSTESSGYWGQPLYTAQEITGSLVDLALVRTQAVSAFGEQLDTSAGLTSAGLDDGAGGLNALRFNPEFPASCPYVLSVGATQINSGATVNDSESACDRVIHSGGGFSDFFSMPSYQSAAVTNFLTTHPPPYSAA
jgi:tripeptidyl-peptidase-1